MINFPFSCDLKVRFQSMTSNNKYVPRYTQGKSHCEGEQMRLLKVKVFSINFFLIINIQIGIKTSYIPYTNVHKNLQK